MTTIGRSVSFRQNRRDYHGVVYATSGRDLHVRYGPGRTHTTVVSLDLVTLADSCFLCKRSDPIKHGTYVRVSWPDGSVKDICDDCFEKADVVETLDMTEDSDA